MNVFGILTLVGVALTLALITVYLVLYLLELRRIATVLGTVSGAVSGIAGQVKPLQPVLSDVNRNLKGARDARRRAGALRASFRA